MGTNLGSTVGAHVARLTRGRYEALLGLSECSCFKKEKGQTLTFFSGALWSLRALILILWTVFDSSVRILYAELMVLTLFAYKIFVANIY